LNNIVNIRSFTTARGVPIVVFLDMQKEYIATPRLIAIPEIERALDNCKKVLTHARSAGLPIVFLRWLNKSSPFFNAATPFVGWIDGFEPQRNEMIFERKQPSCYSSDGFSQLMEHGGNEVVLVGFAGESACLSTIVDAFHRNHRIVYLKDASASHGLVDMAPFDVHDAVSRIAALYGTVASTDAWIMQETQRAAACVD
jgi:nicotinamidase-related amidase